MPHWLVTWTIDDEDSPTPLEAAEAAWSKMRGRESIASVFDVEGADGVRHRVDLAERTEIVVDVPPTIQDAIMAASVDLDQVQQATLRDCAADIHETVRHLNGLGLLDALAAIRDYADESWQILNAATPEMQR